MTTEPKPDAGKPLVGPGMVVFAFVLVLGSLALLFNGVLERQDNPNASPQYREDADGVREVVLRRNRQGHYMSGGRINGTPVTFLLDTGATRVSVPPAIAARAGLQRGQPGQALTANGMTTVYATRIDELVLGNIVLRNVAASISPGLSLGSNTILLGMSALKQVEFTQRGSELTLRQRPL